MFTRCRPLERRNRSTVKPATGVPPESALWSIRVVLLSNAAHGQSHPKLLSAEGMISVTSRSVVRVPDRRRLQRFVEQSR